MPKVTSEKEKQSPKKPVKGGAGGRPTKYLTAELAAI